MVVKGTSDMMFNYNYYNYGIDLTYLSILDCLGHEMQSVVFVSDQEMSFNRKFLCKVCSFQSFWPNGGRSELKSDIYLVFTRLGQPEKSFGQNIKMSQCQLTN